MARRSRILGVTGAAVVVLAGVVAAALFLPTSAPAQRAPDSPPAAAVAQTAPGSAPAAALPPGFVGAETCKGCHEPQFEKFAHTKMGRLFLKNPRNSREAIGCENCHGPGADHVNKGGGKGVGGLITFARNDKTPVHERNQKCLTCHTKGPHMLWEGSAHEARDVACTSCHKVMQDLSPRYQLARPTVLETCGTCHLRERAGATKFSRHPILEGKMTCTSCHNPHGSITQALLKEASPNDTCYTCHTEKRGPFLYEHPPVMESCQNCHDPHGTSNDKMLKLTRPRLCQQCHVETRHPTSPYGRDNPSLKFTMGRACSSCHVNIHGSNHPSGHSFTR